MGGGEEGRVEDRRRRVENRIEIKEGIRRIWRSNIEKEKRNEKKRK